MRVLGIETSCDETGIALLDSDRRLLGEALFSQADIHARHGGVVPELASRNHLLRLAPLLEEALDGASPDSIDAVAYTAGPGLAGALMTGAVFAHALARALGVPAVAVHHMEAHLLTPLLTPPPLAPPFLALLVSGGHTLLARVAAPGRYETLGQSLDDAAGEAFDKTARLLGLGYPGGPAVEKLARRGRPGLCELPRPLLHRGLDFSFSGLKTALARRAQTATDDQARADLALAFEEAVVDTLAVKCARALEQTGARALVAAGGVAANKRLRERLLEHRARGIEVRIPPPAQCTDNGVMIAHAGLMRLEAGEPPAPHPQVRPRWPLHELGQSCLLAPTSAKHRDIPRH